jgi:two-component system, OmpR family, manganese sensing sensor histidine kinase
MFQATRRRLAIWYTSITAILLLFFATGVYLYVRSTLVERIDDTITHIAEVVERSLAIESVTAAEGTYQVNIEASFRNNKEEGEEDLASAALRAPQSGSLRDRIDLEWFDIQGKLLWSTFNKPLDIPLSLHANAKTVYLDESNLLRQITVKIEFDRYILGYLRVSHPWFEVTKPSRQLIIDLTIGISLTIVCVGSIGWFLSGIAIEPVKVSYQSLKQFTADASHELRNPIATILTNIQMALNYPELEPQLQQRQLKVIERLTQRLGNLVNDLLFLARADSGMVQIDYKAVPLDALSIEAIEEQRLLAEQKGIFLSLHIPETDLQGEDIFTIQGDWDRLARLFTNLISNAIEHGFPDDRQPRSIEVELQRIKSSRQPQVRVIVKDTGVGVAESALPHLFDRFYRLDPSRAHAVKSSNLSTGLGLAIVKAIVENHQGQITVESTIDRGTIFTVTLPIGTPVINNYSSRQGG